MCIAQNRGMKPEALLGVQDLAGLLLATCKIGLVQRQRGRCLGSDIANWIQVAEHTISLRVRPNGQVSKGVIRRARRHALSGHDAGCSIFGLATHEVEALLLGSDAHGATPLLFEAFLDAIAEVSAPGSPGTYGFVYGAIESQVHRRVTPTQFELQMQKGGFSAL